MNSPRIDFDVAVRHAWWLRPYTTALCWFAVMSGREPDWNKLARIIAKSVRVQLTVKD